jgi:hypothetical protein
MFLNNKILKIKIGDPIRVRKRKISTDIGTCASTRIPENGALQSYPPYKKNFVLEIQIYMEEECNEKDQRHDDDNERSMARHEQ